MFSVTVHPPAVATLWLRKTAQAAESEYGQHVANFVTNDFYVDDGLTSCPTAEEVLTVDSIPRRVTGLLSGDNWKRNLSVLRSHINPRLRWSGLVLASRSKSFRFVARSLDGKADITSKLFDANL
jgi:hypothetical protein